MYIADAVAGPNGKVVLITGKHEKAIATEQAYATTVAVIDTTNTVKKTTDAIDGRVSTIEGDYLKAADKSPQTIY